MTTISPNEPCHALIQATQTGGKTYSFNNARDDTLPADRWFQQSEEGLVLFLVFYTLACRWSACTGCNLPSVSASYPVSYTSIIAQIDRVFSAPDVLARSAEIRKLIVSNNGSVLDQMTFPSTALMHLIVQINLRLPQLRVISLETRPEYVDFAELEFLSRAMREREQQGEIELAIGFEAFDNRIRNEVFGKGLSLATFEKLVKQLQRPGFRLKCYFMQKPVAGISEEEAIQDIQRGIDYLHQVSTTFGVSINMHLNPTYVSRETSLERDFKKGVYQPPLLQNVIRSVLHAKGKSVSIFVGLSDEGLAVEGGSFLRAGDESLVQALELFNRTQNFSVLQDLVTCTC